MSDKKQKKHTSPGDAADKGGKHRRKAKKKQSKIVNPPRRINRKSAAAGQSSINLNCVQVKAFAMRYITMAECEQTEGLKFELGSLLKKKKAIATAWERGQLLRKLAEFGEGNASISQVETDLDLRPGGLEALFATDAEAAEAFNNTRIATIAFIQKSIVEKVRGGQITVTALRQIETMLRREVAKKSADFEHIPLDTMVDLTGVSRQTIHAWWSKNGMPKNSDGTYNIKQFLPWFEKFTIEKIRPAAAKDNTYQNEKVRRMRAENEEYLGNLLPRDSVLAGWVARYRQLITTLDRQAGELPLLLAGQTAEKMSPVLAEVFASIRKNLCEMPAELKLPASAAAKFAEVLKIISATEEGENSKP